MADTTLMKKVVEPHIRGVLAREFGMPFNSEILTLTTGGTHEFDAVSRDGNTVAAIKSASGRTVRGKGPSGKIKSAEAELYYLTLVSAPRRLLVLTDPEFHEIMCARLEGRLAPGISVRLIELPPHIQSQVRRLQKEASDEVSPRTRE